MSKRVYFREEEFREAFERPRKNPFRRRPVDDPVGSAAHFVGGAFLDQGFRLFKNGGLPLLERRWERLTEEIVFARSPSPGAESLLAVRVHLSHSGLRDIRARYWTTPARAPLILATGNVGELDLPPGLAVWEVASEGPILESLVQWLRALAVPWFELFEDPSELRRTLLERDVPLLSRLDALEWILAEFGAGEGRRYFRHLAHEGLVPEGERMEHLATCFRLR